MGRLGGLAIGVFIKLTEQMFSRSAPSVFSWTKNNHGRWKEVTNDSWHQLPNSKKMSCHLNGTLMSRHQSSYHQQHEINFQAQQVFSGISSSYHQRRKPMFLTRSLGQSCFFDLKDLVPFVAEHTCYSFAGSCCCASLWRAWGNMFWFDHLVWTGLQSRNQGSSVLSLSDARNLFDLFFSKSWWQSVVSILQWSKDLDVQSFIKLGEYDLTVKVNHPFMGKPYEPTSVKWGG